MLFHFVSAHQRIPTVRANHALVRGRPLAIGGDFVMPIADAAGISSIAPDPLTVGTPARSLCDGGGRSLEGLTLRAGAPPVFLEPLKAIGGQLFNDSGCVDEAECNHYTLSPQ